MGISKPYSNHLYIVVDPHMSYDVRTARETLTTYAAAVRFDVSVRVLMLQQYVALTIRLTAHVTHVPPVEVITITIQTVIIQGKSSNP